MSTPRVAPSLFHTALVLLCFCLLGGVARAQPQPQQLPPVANQDTAEGIRLYKGGDAKKAAEALFKVIEKRKDDVNALYYFGLALHSLGELVAARERFEEVVKLFPDFADPHAKLAVALIFNNDPAAALREGSRAVELGDQSAEVHYALGEAHLRQGDEAKALEEAEAALRIKPDLAEALILKSFAYFDFKRYKEAAETLESFLKLNPNNEEAETWREQIEALRRYERSAAPDHKPETPSTTFTPMEVEKKARLLARPEPQYTEEARKAGVQGTVLLYVVLSSDGTVKNIFVRKALPRGLTTTAIRAARKIRFEPATVGGRPVSQYIQIEYNFNLY
jgi:TonB family protein